MNPTDLERALSALGSSADVPEAPERADARRRRVVAHMQRVNSDFVSRAQSARWRRWALSGGLLAATGAAAAVALFFLGAAATHRPAQERAALPATLRPGFVPLRSEMTQGSVVHRVDGRARALGLGDSPILDVADTIETKDGSRARLHGGRGLDIELGPASRLVLGQIEEESGATRLRLERGRVSCSVDPTGEGPKLAVVTPDATVEVEGTVFSVEVLESGDEVRTCVRVQRGLVAVTRGAQVEHLAAGQSSGCAARVADLEFEEAPEASAELSVPQVSRPRGPAASRAAAAVPQVSSLATQNGLFARGLAAERRGQLLLAERELTQLLSRYPETPLRPDVEAALLRILSRREQR